MRNLDEIYDELRGWLVRWRQSASSSPHASYDAELELCDDRIAAIAGEVLVGHEGERRWDDAVATLESLKREHLYLEGDSWYSCGLAVYPVGERHGPEDAVPGAACLDPDARGTCRCGAEAHNNRVDDALEALARLLHVPRCSASLIGEDGVTLTPCPNRAPKRGASMGGQRKPICDEHAAALASSLPFVDSVEGA